MSLYTYIYLSMHDLFFSIISLYPATNQCFSLTSRLLQLAVEADGVVLLRRAGRREGGAPGQEPQEMVGRTSLQRPRPEGLHAPRRLAARRQREEEEEEEREQDEPPELPPRQKNRRPAASRSPEAEPHVRGRVRWSTGRELVAPGVWRVCGLRCA